MKNVLYVILISFLFLSCNGQTKGEKAQDKVAKRRDSIRATEAAINKNLQWKPVTKDSLLWKNKNGDIGIRSAYYVEPDELVETYLTKFCDEANTPYKNIIDAETFKLITGNMGWGGYFKDSRHVYHFFGNSGGGNLSIADVDYKTFENLSDCYARDKNYIYDLRFGKIEEIDAKTFVLIDAEKCIGRDKKGYYNGNDLLTEERLKDDPETRAIIKKDKKRNHKKAKQLSD